MTFSKVSLCEDELAERCPDPDSHQSGECLRWRRSSPIWPACTISWRAHQNSISSFVPFVQASQLLKNLLMDSIKHSPEFGLIGINLGRRDRLFWTADAPDSAADISDESGIRHGRAEIARSG
jgi:signal transduction histidine kinase